MEYWTTTNSKANFNPRPYETAEGEAYLRANVGVDAALLAKDLGIGVEWVKAWQRRLGLRPLTGNHRKVYVRH